MKINKLNAFIINIISIILKISQISEIHSYTVQCDYMGDCSFIIDGKPFEISQRHIPLYKEISNGEIDYNWNDTFYSLKLEKQIDGVSNYGLLKGTKNGYECNGGLWECKDSCCLDGFCVEILFFCDKENEHITTLYVTIGFFFLTLVIFYWFTFCFLGCKYKYDLTKTMKEEEELYLFMKIGKIKGSTNSVSVTENYASQVPMMNNIIKMRPKAFNN